MRFELLVTEREFHTILAALGLWQEWLPRVSRVPVVDERDEMLDAIASNGGTLPPLWGFEIDQLCERLNEDVGFQAASLPATLFFAARNQTGYVAVPARYHADSHRVFYRPPEVDVLAELGQSDRLVWLEVQGVGRVEPETVSLVEVRVDLPEPPAPLTTGIPATWSEDSARQLAAAGWTHHVAGIWTLVQGGTHYRVIADAGGYGADVVSPQGDLESTRDFDTEAEAVAWAVAAVAAK